MLKPHCKKLCSQATRRKQIQKQLGRKSKVVMLAETCCLYFYAFVPGYLWLVSELMSNMEGIQKRLSKHNDEKLKITHVTVVYVGLHSVLGLRIAARALMLQRCAKQERNTEKAIRNSKLQNSAPCLLLVQDLFPKRHE